MGTTRKRKSNRAGQARDADRRSISRERPSTAPPQSLLTTVRDRLVTAASAARLCGTALEAQAADFDVDAAHILRHCICGSLDAGIRVLDDLIAGAAP